MNAPVERWSLIQSAMWVNALALPAKQNAVEHRNDKSQEGRSQLACP